MPLNISVTHFLILSYFFSFGVGFIAIITSIASYVKWKERKILYYLFFLIPLTVNIFDSALSSYLQMLGDLKTACFALTAFLNIMSYSAIIYSMPCLIYSLTGEKFTTAKKIFFSITALSVYPAFSFLLLASGLDSGNFLELTVFFLKIQCTVVIAENFYYTLYLFFKMKNIREKRLHLPVRIFQIIYLVFMPGLLLNDYHPYISSFLYSNVLLELYILGSFPCFYLLWNITGLVSFTGYLFKAVDISQVEHLSGTAFLKYKISDREKQIIDLMLKGLRYREISEKLFISVKTVKTHLHNIYYKTGARNKIELSNLLKGI